MTMPDRIPLPSNFTPPFTADERGTIWGSDGRYVAVSQDHGDTIARVLTAYYADPQPQHPQPVPQFVVVRHGNGEMVAPTAMLSIYEFRGQWTACIGEPGDGDEGYSITEAEYTRLKSILAPGQ